MAETRQTDAKQKDPQARKRKPPVAKAALPAAQVLEPALVQLALVDPASAPQASILHLQRNSGNRAVQRLIQRTREAQHSPAARPASAEVAAQPQPQVVRREAAAPGRTLVLQESISRRPARSAIVHPNRGTLPKAASINRPKFLSCIVQLTPLPESFSFTGEAEGVMGMAMAMDPAYVPPVAPPPAPPGLPKGKPNKWNSFIQAKLTVGPANDRYEQEVDRVMRMTNQDQVGAMSGINQSSNDPETKGLMSEEIGQYIFPKLIQ